MTCGLLGGTSKAKMLVDIPFFLRFYVLRGIPSEPHLDIAEEFGVEEEGNHEVPYVIEIIGLVWSRRGSSLEYSGMEEVPN